MSEIEPHCIERAIAYHQEMGGGYDDEEACPHCDHGWGDDFSPGSVHFGRHLATRRLVICESCHGSAMQPVGATRLPYRDCAPPPTAKNRDIKPENIAVAPVMSRVGHPVFPGLPRSYFVMLGEVCGS